MSSATLPISLPFFCAECAMCIFIFIFESFTEGCEYTIMCISQEMGLQDREWFAGICGRKTAEDTLMKVNKVTSLYTDT